MYNPVVNNVQMSYPGGGAVTASSSVSVIGVYVVNIAIYNSVGELIKTISTFESSSAISAFNLSGTLTTDQSAVTLVADGQVIATWNGTNSQGNLVSNGTYLIKISSTDSYDVTTTVIKDVEVNVSNSTLDIAIYNEAGEVIRTFTQQQLASLLCGANGVLLPADYNVGGTTVSSTVIRPSVSGSGPGGSVTITLGSGRGFAWNGTGNNGQILTNGQYFIVVQSVQNGSQQQIVMDITVQDSGSSPLGVVVAPNPINLNQTSQAKILVNTGAANVDGVRVRIYTIAGELAQTITDLSGNLSQINWDLTQVRWASGTYIVVVELDNNGAPVGRQITRVVLLH
jgi:flagellar hook assembly protein FlgD